MYGCASVFVQNVCVTVDVNDCVNECMNECEWTVYEYRLRNIARLFEIDEQNKRFVLCSQLEPNGSSTR